MKLHKTLIITSALTFAAPLTVSANDIFTGTTMLVAVQSHYGKGKVTKIDKKGKRVELKHGPIKSIGWMGMQMFFDVDDEDMLDDISVGDVVDFEFIKTRDNHYVITDIENDS